MLTDRKSILPVKAANIPNELKALRQWVLWRAELRGDKMSKVPYSVQGGHAQTNAHTTWASFDDAWTAYRAGQADGIGFVFARGGGLCGVDLDDCFDDAGKLHPKAAAIVRELNSYTELSVSGGGLHVICRAMMESGKRRGPLEIYGCGRYFCITGFVPASELRPIREAQGEIDRLVSALSSPATQQRHTVPTGGGYLSNSELIEKAMRAKDGAKFSSLWAGDTAGYSSHSEADIALMCLLLFWTHGDTDRAEGLFYQSGLYRDKWERADYRRRTIKAALDCMGRGDGL